MSRAPILSLAAKSLMNRRLTAGLTLFALAVSMMLVLSVEKVRNEAKLSFASTISGTDLIVGARSGSIQLLLYSVFRIGNATNNISWKSYQQIAARPGVAWTVPMSLGDSHRGFRVLGTTSDYFRYYRYGRKRNLKFASGKPFDDLFDPTTGDISQERITSTLAREKDAAWKKDPETGRWSPGEPQTIMVEVKTSISKRKEFFDVSLQELVSAWRFGSNYWIMRVEDVAGTEHNIRFIKNLSDSLRGGESKLWLVS